MRIFLDSNVWLAIVTCDGSSRAMWREIRNRVVVVGSDWLYGEVNEKLVWKFRFSPLHAERISRYIRRRTISAGSPRLPHPVSRDLDDDLILASAVSGDCEYLVTGDNDLLELRTYGSLKIVKLRELLAALEENAS